MYVARASLAQCSSILNAHCALRPAFVTQKALARRPSKAVWTAGVALGLAGCVLVGPDYVAPALDTPPRWGRLDAAPQPGVDTGEPRDLRRWWQSLNDPLLSVLIDEALRASPDVRLAQARLREARAYRALAVAALFPIVNASGAASRTRSSEAVGSGSLGNYFSAGFDANWELDVFGGTRRGIEAAQADLETTEARLADTQVTLAAEVASYYAQVRAMQLRLRIARDNLASQTDTWQLTEWRSQAGLVSSQDVEQARTNQEQTRAQIPALETSLAAAESAVEILLGQPPGAQRERLAADGDLPAVPEQIAVGIPANALLRRPDVRAAERALAAETARVAMAEAARYPAVDLAGSIGVEALSAAALGGGGTTTSSLLAGLVAPIFDAGRLRDQVRIQDAVREQALVTYEVTVLNALQEVENALVALVRSGERSRTLTRADEAARNAALMARQRYSVGLTDFETVLDTERTVLAVEDSLAGSRTDAVMALIQLYKALGGGWSPPAADPVPVSRS